MWLGCMAVAGYVLNRSIFHGEIASWGPVFVFKFGSVGPLDFTMNHLNALKVVDWAKGFFGDTTAM